MTGKVTLQSFLQLSVSCLTKQLASRSGTPKVKLQIAISNKLSLDLQDEFNSIFNESQLTFEEKLKLEFTTFTTKQNSLKNTVSNLSSASEGEFYSVSNIDVHKTKAKNQLLETYNQEVFKTQQKEVTRKMRIEFYKQKIILIGLLEENTDLKAKIATETEPFCVSTQIEPKTKETGLELSSAVLTFILVVSLGIGWVIEDLII